MSQGFGGGHERRHVSYALVGVVIAAASLMAMLGFGAASASAATQTFEYTGSAQTWTVPAGVTTATFDVYGAGGAAFENSTPTNGGRATATIPVTPLSDVAIYVGGSGFNGGFNGGGESPGNINFMGGGASDIRIGGSALTDRAIVAGGGGGGVTNCSEGGPTGGNGGGLVGGDGRFAQVCFSLFGQRPGTGGTQTQGGTNPGSAAAAGSFGVGGTSVGGGGGGGGGYYGGAGGVNTGGGGGGSGYGPPGTLFETGTHSGNGQIVVTYGPSRPNLAVTTAGLSGFVTSSPAGIDCETGSGAHTACNQAYDEGTAVTLRANPASGAALESWSGGGCSGSAPTCVVEMDQARSVTATFAAGFRLTGSTSGTGSGFIGSDPVGIDCETGSAGHSECNGDFTSGTSVTLTANPADSSVFSGWSGGGCSGTSPTCTVTMDQARAVDAAFALKTYEVSVALAGDGDGVVTSTPAGIACNTTGDANCSVTVDYGESLTLSASAEAGSSFSGWSGDCSGDADCSLSSIDSDRTVTATFTADPPPVAPEITSLRVTPRRFSASPKPTPISRAATGATIEIGLSQKARVKFRFRLRPIPGSGKAPPPPADRPKAIRRQLPAGISEIGFTGTLRKRTLPPGRYQVIARARGGTGLKSEKMRADFRVVR